MSTYIVSLEIIGLVCYLGAIAATVVCWGRLRDWSGTRVVVLAMLGLLALISLANLIEWSLPAHRTLGDLYSDYLGVALPVMWVFLVCAFVKDVTTRELAASEQVSRMLIDNFPHLIYAIDTDGHLFSLAGDVKGITGYEPDELTGLPQHLWRELLHPADAPVLGEIRRGIEDGEEIRQEARFYRKDGEVRLVEVVVTPLLDDEGAPRGRIGVVRDITDERESERRYRTLVATMGDGVTVVQRDGVITYANEAFCQMVEYEESELLGRRGVELCDEANRAILEPQLAQRPSGAGGEYELAFTSKSGRQVPMVVTGTPLYDAGGEVIGSFAVMKDLTERKRAQSQVAAERERSASIIETAQALIVGLDAEGRITLFNRRCEDVTGYNAEEVMGHRVWDFLLPQRFVAPVRQVFEEVRTGDFPNQLENAWLTKEGEERLITWRNTAITDPDGSVREMFGIGLDITEHRAAELAVHESEERFRGIFDQSATGMAVLDEAGHLVTPNETYLKLFGLESADELEGADVLGLLHLPEGGRERIEGGEGLSYEASLDFSRYPLPSSRSGTAEMLVVIAPLRQEGRISGAIVQVQDITERKMSQEALRESEQRYRALVESVPAIFCVLQPDGTTEFVNSPVEEVTGYAPREIIGRNWWRLLYPGDEYGQVEQLFREFERGDVRNYETSVTTKDGRKRVISLNSASQFDDAGRLMQIVCFGSDVTEQKEAERQFRRLQQQHQLLAESGLVGTFIIQDGTFVFANQTMHARLGHPPGGLVGHRAIELFHPDDRDEVAQRLRQQIAGEEPSAQFEARLVTTAGAAQWAQLWLQRIDDYEGKPALIGHAVDATEARELRMQLDHSQRLEALGTLARGVAHDFNNVLQVLLGHITLFQMDKRPSDRDWGRLKAMSDEIEHGARLVSQLLAFSRGGEVERGPVNINDIAQRIAEVLRNTIQRTIAVRADLAEDVWTIEGDSDRLEQVLMNLGVNARDAMPHGGTLVFRTENVTLDDEYAKTHLNVEPGPYVLLSVSDTGFGMDEETAARAFEPFFTTKAVGKGTGLGLAIAHGTLKGHGGHIRVSSELGKGTTFRIYLPAKPGVKAPPRSEEGAPALPGGTETVLVADDEPAVLRFAADGLTAYGYRVLTAESGRAALRVFEEQHEQIDLVILDLVMPDMDGRECLYHLLNIDARAVVLLTSGYAPDGGPEALLQDGVSGYLEKPFALVDLLVQVRSTLDQSAEPK